jgi:hypothetical protein
MQKYWYKIVDTDDKGNIKTLFHGVNGSRIIPQSQWLQAAMKPVKDGTSKTTYISGWHVMKSIEECVDYLTKFKNTENKAIIKVKIKGKVWPKAHSPADVYLAEWLWFEEAVE